MARFFFYSGEGEALFLAHRLQEDGHDVTFWVQNPECRKLRLGEGVVPLAASPEPKKGAVVIFDQTGKGKAGADFRRRGFKVIGGNPFDPLALPFAVGGPDRLHQDTLLVSGRDRQGVFEAAP